MGSISSLPIRRRIVVISMIITAAALFLSGGVLVTYDFVNARRDLRNSATTLARIIADNTAAAVAFNDAEAAVDTLNSVRADPSIVAACVYTEKGLFANYRVSGQPPCPGLPVSGLVEGEYLHIETPIDLNGQQLGSVHLRATMEPMYARLRLEILAIIAILLFSSLFALGLSSWLERFISVPILSLARTANAISNERDYSIRAVKETDDELGQLVDAFNDMLVQIEARDFELQHRATELVKANRTKDEFLATLSHELRTPLNSILGWAILMQGGKLSAERERNALESIERNARLQSRLIEDLLDVSRIITGKFTLESSDVSIKPVVEAAIETIRPIAESKQIHIHSEWPQETIYVSGDAPRLQQAIWNILSNAVKFSPDGGSIDVRLDKAADNARISVVDYGAGIDVDFLPHVFERFRQADGSSTRAYGGLGLGLAIVRHIIEMHGGSVRAQSAGKGRGATFTIELPILDRQRRNFQHRTSGFSR
jgi:signal transduction histidine kinase